MRAASRFSARCFAVTLAATIAGIALGACATSSALRRGQKAEIAADYDRAVIEYTRAAQEKPNDRNVTLGARSREAARVGDAFLARPPARRHRQARRSA